MPVTRATTDTVGNPWKNWLFVRLDTDQPGLCGVGVGSPNALAETVEAAVHEFAPPNGRLNPFRVETTVRRMTRDPTSESLRG